jgi:cold-inducible RNA-binding protein
MPGQPVGWEQLHAAIAAFHAQEQPSMSNNNFDNYLTDAIDNAESSTLRNNFENVEIPPSTLVSTSNERKAMVFKKRWTLLNHSIFLVVYLLSMVLFSEAWIVTTKHESCTRFHCTTTTLPTFSRCTRASSLSVAAREDISVPLPPRRFAQARTNDSTSTNYGSDSKLMSLHMARIKTAGRKGTKRFVDPCKVFVGNLPFDVDSDQLATYILTTMGQSRMNLHACKIIQDWKTGKSKGFGFVEFTDPIFATVCIEACHGKTFRGRPITVSQGKKKDQEQQLYINKKRKDPESEEEKAISDALEKAESDDDDDDDNDKMYTVEELDVDEDGIAIFGDMNEDDLELDAALFGLSTDDDDDDGVDGIFLERKPIYEEMDPNLNRVQRREAARRLKRKKLPHKGFG